MNNYVDSQQLVLMIGTKQIEIEVLRARIAEMERTPCPKPCCAGPQEGSVNGRPE